MHRLAFATFLSATLVLGLGASGSAAAPDPLPLPSGGSGVTGVRVPAHAIAGAEPIGAKPAPLRAAAPVPAAASTTDSPAPRIAFDGIVNATINITPPDTHIAVGPGSGSAGRVVMVTNMNVGIWDKSGNAVATPLLLDTMFGVNAFDPKVLYDQHSGRFFIVALQGKSSTPGTSVIHIAVSSSGSPDDLTGDWTFLSGSAVTTIGGSSTWADYPGIGSDASALFITTNHFTFSSPVTAKGMKIRVFDKTALLAGSYSYSDLDVDNSVTSVTTTQPAHVFGATANGAFYLVSRIGSTSYRLFAVSGHPAAPTMTTATFAWSAGSFPIDDGADQCDQAQPDVDTLSARVQNAVHRDGHIWLVLTSDPDLDDETEVVWQRIATNDYPLASPTISQSGFLDGTGTAPWTYMPAIGVNAAGDAAITYTQSSATECPNMYYATRAAADAAGSFRTPVQQRVSDGFYDSFRSLDPDRWGDYAAVSVDPNDDCFWLASEFVWSSAIASSDWGTHIANVCTSPPAVPALRSLPLAGLAVALAVAAVIRTRRSPRDPSAA